VSAISCFEVTLLANRGKLELPLPMSEWLIEALANSGAESLPIACEIANTAVMLPEFHRDPADRIIIATASVYGAKLASMDSVFPNYRELQNRSVGKWLSQIVWVGLQSDTSTQMAKALKSQLRASTTNSAILAEVLPARV